MLIKFKMSFHFKNMMSSPGIGFFVLFFDALLPASAQLKDSSVSSALGREVYPVGAYLLQASLSLLLITALGFLIFWYLRRFGNIATRKNDFIKIVSVFALNTRDKLLVMQISNEYLLLAASPGNIRLLHKFDASFNPLTNAKSSLEISHQHPQFVQYFMDALSRAKKT